jgi:peptidoglycan hydrolase-like protein with peptidoglycan-binding domain
MGPLDGDFGPATRRAITAWQAGRSEAATGYLTAAQHNDLPYAVDQAPDFDVSRNSKQATAAQAAAPKSVRSAVQGEKAGGVPVEDVYDVFDSDEEEADFNASDPQNIEQFFVTGEIVRPGGYVFTPGMRMRDAISRSGGFTDRAHRDQILIQRGNSRAMKQGVSESAELGAGDIITVKERFF